ncbi:ABC transporter substrate-binding protein [uncultured Methanosphaera sp.]|uniref:ABC transporter substrate-binding protein n=1 Tax=uncultured Methanosphaera sp. TaxID=262501 RepID=UPI0025E78B44|nr:ABC transporter substrate-binding protein [uncultured Methanosphaera sp.]
MERKYIIGIVVLLVIIIIAAIAITQGNSSNRADDELVVALSVHGGEPEGGFDPITGWATGTEPLIQSTLFKRDANATLVNDLATGYNTSSDFKTYTVNIRDGVKFTDNSSLTAEDVAFTYNKAKESGASADLSTMDNATAVNDTTVQFTLNKPDSTFINKLTQVGIVPSDSYNNETYGEHPVGSGPYKLVQWDKGQQVILERNDDYYGTKPYYRKITNLFLDSESAYAAAKNGEVDVAEVPVQYAHENITGMHTEVYQSLDVRGISLPVVNNTGQTSESGSSIGNNVTADPAIREALNVGINRSQIIQTAFNGYAEPAYSGIASSVPWSSNYTVADGDVDQAKQILADAGWTDTNGDGIVEKDGQPAQFELDYSSSDASRQAMAVGVSEQAKKIGINVTPKGSTWDEMDKVANSNPIVFGFGSLDPYIIYQLYDSEGAGNGYNDPGMLNDSELDSLIDTAMSQDVNSSYSTWSQALARGDEDNSWLWVASMDYILFVSDDVDISNSTHTVYPHGGDAWGNIYDWKHVETNETNSTNSTK